MITDSPQYEQECWIKFRNGDDAALHRLYDGYYDRLYNYGFKFSRDTAMIEDAVQDLFLKLMRSRQNLAIPDSVKAYLLRSFRNILLEKLERVQKQTQRELTVSVGFDLVCNHGQLEQKESEIVLNAKLQQAIAQLTPRQREAVFLRYSEEVPYGEIADMLGLSQKAAYKLIGRAVSALRELMGLFIGFSLAIYKIICWGKV